MATATYALGRDLWIPGEVQPGSVGNQRRVYVRIAEAEWFGFVNAADVREEGGHAFIRATVIGVGS